MLILGISGGLEPVYRSRLLRPNEAHDAAAVLIDDGEVASAIEEERLNRVKHTNAMPVEAIRRCLRNHDAALRDVDALAVYGNEALLNGVCRRLAAVDPERAEPTIRALIHRTLIEELGDDLADDRIHFVHHHLCHAMSTFVPSGFESSLVVTIDGVGDELSGMVLSGRDRTLKVLRELPERKSLGDFYSAVVRYLGFGDFDEYKVMGLAPYGDATRVRSVFGNMYALLPHGDYELNWDRIHDIAAVLGPSRAPDESPASRHTDIAAGLQEALEAIVFHMMRYYRQSTGLSNLCLAGGVAQNCSVNGRLLASGLFRDIFVQPASYDAGCALGAAWHCHWQRAPQAPRPPRLSHVFWGSDLGDAPDVERRLAGWDGVVEYQRVDDPSAAAARLLAEGNIIAWAQGRSEFGPRALGNRSILADARPAANKDVVNAAVKKREAFRPFAPAVLEEKARDFFGLAANESTFSFMTFIADVRPECQALLGAVTHVDGTARLQTVSRATNPRFWRLIAEFDAITGVPVVLNTSFNNNAEPIVDSVDDAVACFLTTGLHKLVVGDFVVSKSEAWQARALERLRVMVPPHVSLEKSITHVTKTETRRTCWLVTRQRRRAVTEAAFDLLERAALSAGRRDGMSAAAPRSTALAAELIALWGERLIACRPVESADAEPSVTATLDAAVSG